MARWDIRTVWIVQRISTGRILRVCSRKYMAVEEVAKTPGTKWVREDIR